MTTDEYPLLNTSFWVPEDEPAPVAPVWPEGLPQPGFVSPTPDYEAYAKWPAMNATVLLWGLKSAEHMKAAMDGHLSKQSTALNFGKAFHMRLLEPHLFHRTYVVQQRCSAMMKSKKQCSNTGICVDMDAKWFCGVHAKGDGTFITPSDSVTLEEAKALDAMAAKVFAHDVVKLLRQHGGFETTGICSIDDVAWKFRLDKYIDSPHCPLTVIDLKKIGAGSAETEKFMRDACSDDRNYDVRAALQVDAVKSLTGTTPQFIWVVVEDEYPYGINVIRASKNTLAIGRWKYQHLMAIYHRCMESGEWPGYCTDVQNGEPPDYIMRQWGMLR